MIDGTECLLFMVSQYLHYMQDIEQEVVDVMITAACRRHRHCHCPVKSDRCQRSYMYPKVPSWKLARLTKTRILNPCKKTRCRFAAQGHCSNNSLPQTAYYFLRMQCQSILLFSFHVQLFFWRRSLIHDGLVIASDDLIDPLAPVSIGF